MIAAQSLCECCHIRLPRFLELWVFVCLQAQVSHLELPLPKLTPPSRINTCLLGAQCQPYLGAPPSLSLRTFLTVNSVTPWNCQEIWMMYEAGRVIKEDAFLQPELSLKVKKEKRSVKIVPKAVLMHLTFCYRPWRISFLCFMTVLPRPHTIKQGVSSGVSRLLNAQHTGRTALKPSEIKLIVIVSGKNCWQ